VRLWAYLQDNSIPGCGDWDCCGPDFDDKGWDYQLSVNPMTAEQYQIEFGGGPVLEIREATQEEANGYWAGHSQGISNGWENAELWFQKKQDREFQENMVMDEMTRFKLSEMQTRSCQKCEVEAQETLHERTNNDESEPSEPSNVAYSARTSEFGSNKQLLDPATLTPESLYELQSQTWAQGSEYQRDLWLARLNRIRTWNPTSSADFHEGALHERMRIIDLIQSTYVDMELQETGSFVWSEDIVELIEKDTK
jgi:hypothetical protein